jgi:hypothetical protein
MAKAYKVDKRSVLSTESLQAARMDPRMPERLEDKQMVRPKNLPGMNGKKLKSIEQLKAYISKIPACPRESK